MIERMKQSALLATQVAALVTWAEISHADPTWSPWGTIQSLEAGWVLDSIAVFHSATIINPAQCKFGFAYVTDPADPGHNLFDAALLTAFVNQKEVRLLIEGCAFDKPHLIAVGVR